MACGILDPRPGAEPTPSAVKAQRSPNHWEAKEFLKSLLFKSTTVGREAGGGIGMGNTCKSMADSYQCMAKTTTIL